MALEAIFLIANGEWMHVFLVIAVSASIIVPEVLRQRLGVEIPSEVQILASIFLFASLFLGEVRDFYERFWWWDIALHATAGLLLGLVGFIVAFVLNQSAQVHFRMRPMFVALFAFLFSVSLGALWEIFEFGMDEFFGLTMQKPVPGDPSGLTDTMRDLLVDTLGAALISLWGWYYLTHRRPRYVDTWVGRMLRRRSRRPR
ncbi:hypothetical protein GCM10023325_13440 [Sphingomonas lutea]